MARSDRRALLFVLGIAVVSGSALVAVPALAADGATDPATPPARHVVVCDSGIIDHGDGIQTSSASAEWVPADAPVPAGCAAP